MFWPFTMPSDVRKLTAAESMDRLLASPEWLETQKQAQEAERFWRETYRSTDPELRKAMVEEGRIKLLHRGGRP